MAKKTIKSSTNKSQKPIEQYEHKDKQRLNNPPVGLVDAHTDNGGTTSLPFTPGKAVAVKIIDAKGD